jgi:hypothetical protein
LLIETDAPDQLLPDARNRHPLTDERTGRAINHPANLAAVYDFAGELFGEPVASLAARAEENFLRVFGGLERPPCRLGLGRRLSNSLPANSSNGKNFGPLPTE